MNILARLQKLEQKLIPPDLDGLCECINGIITEFRKDPDATYPDHVPVRCDSCRRERKKIIVEFVRREGIPS